MAGERYVAVVLVDVEVDDVGQRVVLCIKAVAADLLDENLDVFEDGFHAEQA